MKERLKMSLNIKIENFEGPFDLLLHLIKKNKMDIYNVEIHEITNQYIQYIHRIKKMDLELTSEFIVMASTLLEIKSRTLLPKPLNQDKDNEEEEDPRKELVAKLVKYNKFKKAAKFLRIHESEIGRSFSKKPEIIVRKKEDCKPKNFLKNITILKLYNIYSKLMDKYIEKMNLENGLNRKILRDKFKIEDKMNYIKINTKSGKTLKFSSMLNRCRFKIEKVVTFIALLELIRLGMITAMQEGNFGEIYIEKRVVENE